MANGSDLQQDNVFDDTYFPRIGGHIAHYYGDHIRKMFLGVAVALLLSAPFLSGVLESLAPLHILLAPILIAFSALTTPRSQLIMMGNVAVAAFGAIIFELITVSVYRQDYVWSAIAYEAIALIFVFSLYFSLKTLRTMRFGLIGKRDLPGEFIEEKYEEVKKDRVLKN